MLYSLALLCLAATAANAYSLSTLRMSEGVKKETIDVRKAADEVKTLLEKPKLDLEFEPYHDIKNNSV